MNEFNMFDDANFDVVYHLAKSGGDVELITTFIKDNNLKFTPDIDLTNNTLLTMLFSETGDIQRYFDDHFWEMDEYYKKCINKKPKVIGIDEYFNRLVKILAAYHLAQSEAESPDCRTLSQLLEKPRYRDILSNKDLKYLADVAGSRSHSYFVFDSDFYKYYVEQAKAVLRDRSLARYINILDKPKGVETLLDELFVKAAFYKHYGDALFFRLIELNGGLAEVASPHKELDKLMSLLKEEAIHLRKEAEENA